MEIAITKEQFEAVGAAALKPYGLDEDQYRWGRKHDVDLRRLTQEQIVGLIDLYDGREVRGAKRIVSDCRAWLKAIDGEDVKNTNIERFEKLVTEFLFNVPGQLLWTEEGGAWIPRRVDHVRFYHAEHYQAAYVSVTLQWRELGADREQSICFERGDVWGKTCREILAGEGYHVGTGEMREAHEAAMARYEEIYSDVGRQVLGDGTGEEMASGERAWWWHSTRRIVLERDGEPARLVVDVPKEGDEREERARSAQPTTFWKRYRKEEKDDDEDEAPMNPIVPYVATFDLRRHMRLKVHVSCLTDYVYDETLADKLVLPDEVRLLVRTLLTSGAEFNDVVAGKGRGVVILCAGPPGTGKTMTAEVYAESLKRPLYSVQCSQLGTDPSALEESLLTAFARAKRWGAILLLDEADVYVMSRGSDIVQNAIVGVFLRTMEYYGGVLFMTTNRADLVDDAVASRCVARVDYTLPGAKLLPRIWEVLALASDTVISQKVVAAAVSEWPGMSGRDVKNILKLAVLMSAGLGKPIDFEMLEYVKRFKPTAGS